MSSFDEHGILVLTLPCDMATMYKLLLISVFVCFFKRVLFWQFPYLIYTDIFGRALLLDVVTAKRYGNNVWAQAPASL